MTGTAGLQLEQRELVGHSQRRPRAARYELRQGRDQFGGNHRRRTVQLLDGRYKPALEHGREIACDSVSHSCPFACDVSVRPTRHTRTTVARPWSGRQANSYPCVRVRKFLSEGECRNRPSRPVSACGRMAASTQARRE